MEYKEPLNRRKFLSLGLGLGAAVSFFSFLKRFRGNRPLNELPRFNQEIKSTKEALFYRKDNLAG